MKTKLLILTLLTTLLQANNSTSVTPPANTEAEIKKSSQELVKKAQMQGNNFSASLVTASSNTSWIDQKIEEIKPQRHGLNNSALATLKSPFIVVIEKKDDDGSKTKKPSIDTSATNAKLLMPTKKDMSKEPLTLQIVLNSSALINGKWMKENDTFRGYKLAQIQNNHVVLERKNKKIKLFIAQKSDNINISTK